MIKKHFGKHLQNYIETEKQLKQVKAFTNSYSSYSFSKKDESKSAFDNMINVLGDMYEKEVSFWLKNRICLIISNFIKILESRNFILHLCSLRLL